MLVDARVEDGWDLVLGMSINFHQKQRGLDMVGYGTCVVRFQEGDVEHRMDETHSVRKRESERMAGDLSFDRERSQTFVVQLV